MSVVHVCECLYGRWQEGDSLTFQHILRIRSKPDHSFREGFVFIVFFFHYWNALFNSVVPKVGLRDPQRFVKQSQCVHDYLITVSYSGGNHTTIMKVRLFIIKLL